MNVQWLADSQLMIYLKLETKKRYSLRHAKPFIAQTISLTRFAIYGINV